MKAWITKYLFTRGVFEIDCTSFDNSPSTIREVGSDGRETYNYYHGSDWWPSLESARRRAYQVIGAKRRTLNKSLEKLDDLEKSLEEEGRA